MFNPECRRRCLHLSDLRIGGAYKIAGSDTEPNGVPEWPVCDPTSDLPVTTLLNLAGRGFVYSIDNPTCVFAAVSSSSFTTTFLGLGTLTHWNRISLCVATWPGNGAFKIALSDRTLGPL
ncbi:hypothetical protein GYMLUDRAFT_249705 [Collybiopsis luxurians FD-317 M1]|uniref:Unplaced genomic scaffold GYMLUscaffold_70, whole genome shotgun sequence n=1 Tax=Collybiopsis luxurians FD-317 M1 TaxID=944289 RepID=A0A0D0C8G1_9AGAR|nr:hypothetical protein GYMLUDRAFT_249705 [Collybiopsis luxurians FD-317 M1]